MDNGRTFSRTKPKPFDPPVTKLRGLSKRLKITFTEQLPAFSMAKGASSFNTIYIPLYLGFCRSLFFSFYYFSK